MSTKFSLTVLKQQLKTKTVPELTEEIAALCKKFPQVKEYYQVTFSGQDDVAVQNKYKAIVNSRIYSRL